MTRKLGIIVLCTGNSCRSQMAEGFLRHEDPAAFEGTEAQKMEKSGRSGTSSRPGSSTG